jgi:predicted metalloprotease with PDZ domain
VTVPELVPWGTPAFNAGLEADDAITAVEGKRIADHEDWRAAIRTRKPGDRVTVEYRRRGESARTTLVLAEDPAMEIVTVESSGGTPTPAQRAFRQAWMGSQQR